MFRFHWDDWNLDHATRHGVSTIDAEFLVQTTPQERFEQAADEKFRVVGRTDAGELIQVVFALKTFEDLDYEALSIADIIELEVYQQPLVYVIHSRPLTVSEKRRFNRRR